MVIAVIAVLVVRPWDTPGQAVARRAPVSVDLASPVEPPQEWFSSQWDPLLGTEDWRDGDLGVVDRLATDVADPAGARAAARAALTARLSADPAARTGFEAYLADPFAGQEDATDPTGRFSGLCRDVEVAGAAPARLPGPGEVAKVLVVWGGDCVDGLSREVLAGRPRESNTFQASYVYLRREAGTWTAVRETQLPGSAAGHQDSGAGTQGHLLAPLRCGTSPLFGTARVEVVEALSSMCQDAAADRVGLTVTGALRSVDEQRAAARTSPGRAERTGQDTPCRSRHCAGWAVDVAGEGAAKWLSAVVGCQLADGVARPTDGACPAGVPVERALSYGFTAPYQDAPGHLEYVLPPLEPRWTASCDPPAWASPPEVVASVWRCRLGESGASREEVRQEVARALVVARCESGWNPSLVTAQGRVGLFAMDDTAVRTLTGSGAGDPVANADAAARTYLNSRRSGSDGFAPWTCGASLPGAGAAMPAWAYSW